MSLNIATWEIYEINMTYRLLLPAGPDVVESVETDFAHGDHTVLKRWYKKEEFAFTPQHDFFSLGAGALISSPPNSFRISTEYQTCHFKS